MAAPEILLNENNLFSNVEYLLKNKISLFAVLKANAYGHGAFEIARSLEKKYSENSIPYFCLARQSEVDALRNQNIKRSCLVLSEWDENLNFWPENVTVVVASLEDANRLPVLKNNFSKKVHIKINTGMNRLGIWWESLDLIEKVLDVLGEKKYHIEGIMSHLARGEEAPENFSHIQEDRFHKCLTHIQKIWKTSWGAFPKWIHLSNSEGVFHGVGVGGNFSAIRPGLALWGVQENSKVPHKNPHIKPVLNVRASIRQIFNVNEGDGVGYGHAFRATKNIRLATVVLGYADGVRRENMNSQTHLGLYWKQKKLPFVGRISMDLCMVDASDTECQVGDWLYWIGENQGVDIHADRLGTISYEVLCALGSRFLRKMVNSEMEAKGVKLP